MADFFKNLQECAETTISNGIKAVTNKKNEIWSDIQKSTLFSYGVISAFWLIKQVESVKAKSKQIYNSNSLIKAVVDIFVYSARMGMATLRNQRIEPFKSNWISTSVLMKKNPSMFTGAEYSYLDLYDFIKEPIDKNLVIGFTDSCQTLNSMVSNTANMEEGMVTMKVGEKYVNYIYPKPKDGEKAIEIPLVPCKFSFLSIQYTHPLMDETIYIDLDKQFYYSKNEILSPLFIQRCLEYQPANYHFDMDYELHIIDNDIETFSLNSNQYILLSETKYEIVNLRP